MNKHESDHSEVSLGPEKFRILFPSCRLVSLDKILGAPDFPLPPICKCDYDIKPLLPCYNKKTCTADCMCDMHICTCDPVCPCLMKCNHCYCDNKFGKSPLEISTSLGCEMHARTLFKVAK